MSASKNLGKVFMTPKGIWDKTLNYTKLDIVTNKVGKISCGYIATTDIEKNVEITDNRWLKLFELLDGDLTEEYKAVQTDVTNKATDVDTNKKAVDLIYSQMQKLYDVEISTTTPTNERTGLWINPDDISSIINIPEIKDNEVSDVDTWSSKKIDNVTNSLKEDISTKITKFYASSQGETHLADSDNGKIQDMMVYGKSEQKQYSGKNLLNATFQTTTVNGVTCTANGDGTYTLNGTATTITIFDIAQDVSCSSFRLVGCPVGGVHDASYELQARTNNLIYGYDTGDGKNIKADENFSIRIRINTGINCNNLLFKPMIVDASLYPDATYDDFEPYTGGKPSPSPDYPQEIKSVVNPIVKVANKDGTQFKTATLPYTLNAIPVSSGGNVTIDGQQYIADYVDVERGKLVKKIKEISKDPIVLVRPTNNPSKKRFILGKKFLKAADNFNKWSCKCSNLQTLGVGTSATYGCVESCGIDTGGDLYVYYEETSEFTTAEEFKAWWGKRDIQLMGILETPIEIDLTSEEIAAFKALVTYYPTTNISVNSEQLDGYTVFNYPISMENGWNYVKQQIGDTRNYIYDMDARTQDTDLQAAEAYVNSEYAVALTELEV